MYNSMHSFYVSKEWKDLREVLKIDRGMMCEECGKLIHRNVDAIGHHKIELDMTNVNDPTVSLNLDNLMLVCHRCHNLIHNRFGGKGSRTQHRYLVYGPPLAGKHTWVGESASKNDLVISMDDIRFGITGGKYYDNSNATLEDVYAVRDLLLDRVRAKATKAHDVYIVGGYPYKGERERLMRELKLEPVYIECSRDDCLLRLESKPELDAKVWTGYINDWFSKFS